MIILEQFARNCPCFKNNVNRVDSRYSTFQDRGPKGLMLHSVGCPQPRADVFARNWDRADNNSAITHAVLQADGYVYQLLPWNYRAWHAGGDANNTHIGVEMTEPSQITYTHGAEFTCSDLESARRQAEGTYKTARDLFAMLCKEYGLDPMKDIISHAEGAKKGIASNHADPEHLWKGLGLDYTMDGFRADVKARMEFDEPKEAPEEPKEEPKEEPEAPKIIYRVQVGAFLVRENAERFLEEVQEAGFENAFIAKSDQGVPGLLYKVKVTAGSGLNIRLGPGKEYSKAGALEYGDVVGIYKEETGWGQLTNGNWISLEYTDKI